MLYIPASVCFALRLGYTSWDKSWPCLACVAFPYMIQAILLSGGSRQLLCFVVETDRPVLQSRRARSCRGGRKNASPLPPCVVGPMVCRPRHVISKLHLHALLRHYYDTFVGARGRWANDVDSLRRMYPPPPQMSVYVPLGRFNVYVLPA